MLANAVLGQTPGLASHLLAGSLLLLAGHCQSTQLAAAGSSFCNAGLAGILQTPPCPCAPLRLLKSPSTSPTVTEAHI